MLFVIGSRCVAFDFDMFDGSQVELIMLFVIDSTQI